MDIFALQDMWERLVVCVLQMKCRLGLDELESTSGHLNHKVSAHGKQSIVYWQIVDLFKLTPVARWLYEERNKSTKVNQDENASLQ